MRVKVSERLRVRVKRVRERVPVLHDEHSASARARAAALGDTPGDYLTLTQWNRADWS